MKGFDVFRDEVSKQLCSEYPNLHLLPGTEGDLISLKGSFPIKDEAGRMVDRFSIKLQVPVNFPTIWPKMWETAGRIPRTMDRHCYDGDGSACIMPPEEAYFTLPDDISILQYLNGPVRNYFVSQISYELNGKWPWGERSHSEAGILEFYQELFGFTDNYAIGRFLVAISKEKIKGHWPCPCESGEIIRRCHRDVIYRARDKIPPQYLIRAFDYLRKKIELEK